ncbi:MAG TPA: hypothetical protein VIG64_15705 [Actinomycetota bacterium]|jgi:hypothetical protein
MNTEDVLRRHLHDSSGRIPLRPLQLETVLRRARRHERRRRVTLAVGVAACIAIAAVAVSALWPEADKGRALPPVGPAITALTARDAHELMTRFIARLDADDVNGSRALLSPGARDRAGDTWSGAMGPLRAQLDWTSAPDVDVTITTLPTGIGKRYVATFTAPVEDGSALLFPAVIEIVDGEPLLDLASARLRHDISVTPVAPEFFACSPGCDPRDMWPEVSDGSTFFMVLDPADEVAGAWFAVGGDAWVAEASLTPGDESSVSAQATFDAARVEAGTNVFLVAIETRSGSIEVYGYRVRV